MSDTQYDVVKEIFPEWAELVETTAEAMVQKSAPPISVAEFNGRLWGLRKAMELAGLLSEAGEFIKTAVRRAEKARK